MSCCKQLRALGLEYHGDFPLKLAMMKPSWPEVSIQHGEALHACAPQCWCWQGLSPQVSTGLLWARSTAPLSSASARAADQPNAVPLSVAQAAGVNTCANKSGRLLCPYAPRERCALLFYLQSVPKGVVFPTPLLCFLLPFRLWVSNR